ncbi:MAG: hypothetical protein FWE67_10905, partial [Planctomycetaceae bacterium]|nr:hypothetical protein [Planctomycetaceae bacterium]
MSNQMIRQIQRQLYSPFRCMPELLCVVMFILLCVFAVQLSAQVSSQNAVQEYSNTQKQLQTHAVVYRIQCRDIGELEKQLRSQFSSDISFSLNITAEPAAACFRLAMTANESTQQNILAALRQNGVVFLPKNSNTVPISGNVPQQYVQQHAQQQYPNKQTGFVPPQLPANEPRAVQPAYTPPTNPSANAAPVQNPIRPAIPEVAVNEVRDSFSPSRVPVAKVEMTLKSLLGARLNEVAPSKYLLEVKEKKSNRRKNCTIDVDRENNRFVIAGEKTLCDQIVRLFAALDTPISAAGMERQFISTANINPDTVAGILDASKKQRKPLFAEPATIPHPAVASAVASSPAISAPPVNVKPNENLPKPQFTQPVPPPSEEPPKIEFRQQTQPRPSASVPRPNPGIQLVGYEFQGDLPAGGGFDAGMGGAMLDPQMTGQQMYPQGNQPGMEVVSDFRYQILSDLDVLIIDATGAEVARFRDMIEQIQELSKIADPKIEIYYLKHVNCVSLNFVVFQLFTTGGYFRTKQGMVTIIPLINPNGILVVGWGHAFDSMKDLLETLDKPVAAENSMMQIIRLQHASAQYVMTVLRGAFPRPPL